MTARARPAAATPAPTPEQLLLAYRQLRRPHTWPPLEQALQHPIYGKCLRAMARQMARPAWRGATIASSLPATGLPPVPPTPSAPPVRPKAVGRHPDMGEWQRRGIDLKRAAANDRDD